MSELSKVKHGSNWRSVRESSLCILKALLNRIVAIAHSNLFISFESWLSFISIFRSFMSVTVTGSLETFRFNLDLILSRLLQLFNYFRPEYWDKNSLSKVNLSEAGQVGAYCS